jgi:hypothetical protein
MVEVAYSFLRKFAKFSSPKRKPKWWERGSYGWSRFFHNWTDYPVSNGEFLAALQRFPEARIWPRGLNAAVNINCNATMRRIGFLVGREWQRPPPVDALRRELHTAD